MGRFLREQLRAREESGHEEIIVQESCEWKYNVCMLFYCLQRDDEEREEGEERRYSVFDRAWVMERFRLLLHVPRYALIKTCPHPAFTKGLLFNPLIYDGKLYSKEGGDIRVTSCSDDSYIVTLVATEKEFANISCLIIGDGKLYSTDENSIKVWRCSTDSLIKTLTGHTSKVMCLQFHDGKLYSSSFDGSIKVWNGITHELMTTLGVHGSDESAYEGHKRLVNRLTINDGKLYSGGGDMKIKVWNCSTNKLITTLPGHNTGMIFMIHEGRLFTSAWGDINVHDCSDGSFITTLQRQGTTSALPISCSAISPVEELTFQNGKLYSKYFDNRIAVFQL